MPRISSAALAGVSRHVYERSRRRRGHRARVIVRSRRDVSVHPASGSAPGAAVSRYGAHLTTPPPNGYVLGDFGGGCMMVGSLDLKINARAAHRLRTGPPRHASRAARASCRSPLRRDRAVHREGENDVAQPLSDCHQDQERCDVDPHRAGDHGQRITGDWRPGEQQRPHTVAPEPRLRALELLRISGKPPPVAKVLG